jgi:hypothetical protein
MLAVAPPDRDSPQAAQGIGSSEIELAPIRTGPSSLGCIERATLTLRDWGLLGRVERSAH